MTITLDEILNGTNDEQCEEETESESEYPPIIFSVLKDRYKKKTKEYKAESLEHLHTALEHRALEDKFDGKMFILSSFRDRGRKKHLLKYLSGVCFDVDNTIKIPKGVEDPSGFVECKPVENPITTEEMVELLDGKGAGYILFSSFSHNLHKEFKRQDGSIELIKLPRFKVVLLFDQWLDADYADTAYSYVHEKYFDGLPGVDLGNVVQFALVPSCSEDRLNEAVNICKPGARIPVIDIIDEHQRREREKPKRKKRKRGADSELENAATEILLEYLELEGIGIHQEEEKDGYRLIVPDECPYNFHTEGHYPAYFQIFPSGMVNVGCHKTTCEGNEEGAKFTKLLKEHQPDLHKRYSKLMWRGASDSKSNEKKSSSARDALEKQLEKVLEKIPDKKIERENVVTELRPYMMEIAVDEAFANFVGELTLEKLNNNFCPECEKSELDAVNAKIDVFRELKYVDHNGGMAIKKIIQVKDKTETKFEPISNFPAHISADKVIYDGIERARHFRVDYSDPAGNPMPPITIEGKEFNRLDWVTEHLGANYAVAGNVRASELLEAMKLTGRASSKTGEIPCEFAFGHTGWRIEGERVGYLAYSGEHGPDGLDTSVDVELGGERFNQIALPDTAQFDEEEIIEAARCAYAVLDVGKAHITYVVFIAAFLGPLLPFIRKAKVPSHTDTFVGPSGTFKSAICGVLQSFFGSAFHGNNLPESWQSTDNALEGAAFTLKDMPLVIDEMTHDGTPRGEAELLRKMERIIRGQGNNAGRSRASRDGKRSKHAYYSRAHIVTNGESLQGGHSLLNRMHIVQVGPGDIDQDRLRVAQANGSNGKLSLAMAVFIEWVALNYSELEANVPLLLSQLRDELQGELELHARMPDILAVKLVVMKAVNLFAIEVGVISPQKASRLYNEAKRALIEAVNQNVDIQQGSSPERVFLTVLEEGFLSGAFHAVSTDPEKPRPETPIRFGWFNPRGSKSKSVHAWEAQGEQIAWYNAESYELYLNPKAAYAAVKRFSRSSDTLNTSRPDTWKRLQQKGLLSSDGDKRPDVNRAVPGQPKKKVICLSLEKVDEYLETEREEVSESDSDDDHNGEVLPFEQYAKRKKKSQ